MRDRPYITAGESPRPYSEIRRENEQFDVVAMQRRALWDQVHRLEGQARLETNSTEAKRLQLEAEALRCRLHHGAANG